MWKYLLVPIHKAVWKLPSSDCQISDGSWTPLITKAKTTRIVSFSHFRGYLNASCYQSENCHNCWFLSFTMVPERLSYYCRLETATTVRFSHFWRATYCEQWAACHFCWFILKLSISCEFVHLNCLTNHFVCDPSSGVPRLSVVTKESPEKSWFVCSQL